MIRILCLLLLTLVVLAGCQSGNPATELAIRAAWTHRIPGLEHYSLGSGINIWVDSEPIVTAANVERAWYVRDNLNRPAVMVKFNTNGTARMSQFSAKHISSPLAVFVNRNLVSAPVVEGEISSTFMIMGLGDQPHVEYFIKRLEDLNAAATASSTTPSR